METFCWCGCITGNNPITLLGSKSWRYAVSPELFEEVLFIPPVKSGAINILPPWGFFLCTPNFVLLTSYFPYILSGTSIPNSAKEDLITSPTALESCTLNFFSVSSSVPKMVTF